MRDAGAIALGGLGLALVAAGAGALAGAVLLARQPRAIARAFTRPLA